MTVFTVPVSGEQFPDHPNPKPESSVSIALRQNIKKRLFDLLSFLRAGRAPQAERKVGEGPATRERERAQG